MPESLESLEHRVHGRVRAIARVAGLARALWDTTDDSPLINMSSEQGMIWDDLCAALVAWSECEID